VTEEVIATIESAIKEGTSHLEKLHTSAQYLQRHQPFSPALLETVDSESVLHMDQFIYRFTKLQDSMARRLLPSLYTLLEADTEPKAFLDILNRLEQLNAITSVETWQRFRNLRNNLAHDYPESLSQTAGTLNELLDTWSQMEAMFNLATRTYRSRHDAGQD
jgi:hypothetical protein